MSGNDERVLNAPVCECNPPTHRNFWKIFDSKDICIGWYLQKDYLVNNHMKGTVTIAYQAKKTARANYFNFVNLMRSVECAACNVVYHRGPVFKNVKQACRYHIEMGDIG